MSVTIAQLKILAEKYKFDMDDARLTIGLVPSKRGRAAKCSAPEKPVTTSMFTSYDPYTPTEDKKLKKDATKKIPDANKAPRGKSGFNLYMAEARYRVKSDLDAQLKKGGKLERGAVMSEVGKRWRCLPESSREIWNNKARGLA